MYVTKMQPFSSRLYNLATRNYEQSVLTQRLVAIARVYSGTLRKGSRVFVFGANHSTESPEVTEVEIPNLFLLMGGQGLESIDQAGPGCIVGIGGTTPGLAAGEGQEEATEGACANRFWTQRIGTSMCWKHRI